ncbi:hypothetical protein FQN54_008140 [Arachnomyces sp. PD_36]|nr:hypothetical protein FQN54_008140 [Arachnomyces sp. PD_36]
MSLPLTQYPPGFRGDWMRGQWFLRFARIVRSGGSLGFAHGEMLCKEDYGRRYYNQPVVWRWDLQLLLLGLWGVLQTIAMFFSSAYQKYALKEESGAIVLVLLGVIANLTAAYYQWHGGRMPPPRATFLHGVSSLSSAVVNVALATYDFNRTWSKPADRYSIMSAVLLAVSGVVLSLNSLQMFSKEVTDILKMATWAELLHLLLHRIPPDSLLWDCLPEKEKNWALEAIMKYQPANPPSANQGGPSDDPRPPPESHPLSGDHQGDTSPGDGPDDGPSDDRPTRVVSGGSQGDSLTILPSSESPSRSGSTVPDRPPSVVPPVASSDSGPILTDEAPDTRRRSGRARHRPNRYGWDPASC